MNNMRREVYRVHLESGKAWFRIADRNMKNDLLVQTMYFRGRNGVQMLHVYLGVSVCV